jgi:hypothetical protein
MRTVKKRTATTRKPTVRKRTTTAKKRTVKRKPSKKTKPAVKRRVKPAVKPKRTVKKRTVKRSTSIKRTATNPKVRAKSDGLNGRPSPATRQVSKAVKAAKREGEKEARKKFVKTNKAKMERVLKSGKEKINRLLKQNKTRISEILRGGAKRKRKAKQRQPVENPFDKRRFRGNRRKKKETAEQRLKRIESTVHSVRDQILYGIADGSFKFKWASIAKEAGYGNGERKSMLSILDNKGYTVNQLAHKIWEDNGGSYGHVKDDDLIRNEILDVLHTVNSRTDALNQLDRGQGGDTPF